jgi:hypothetical protein
MGDEVSVEVETQDADLFFDSIYKHGEQINLLLLGVIAINCMVIA